MNECCKAAVAWALERAAQVCDEWATKHLVHKERDYPYHPTKGYYNPAQAAARIAKAIRALKPRSDMVCVPRRLLEPEELPLTITGAARNQFRIELLAAAEGKT